MNHLDEAKEHLRRRPQSLPTLNITRTLTALLDYEASYSEAGGYGPHLAIPAPAAV